jgi:hypothetical protein
MVAKIAGRLFTFGCSFTNFSYPTWADILGRDFEYFENWGHSGGGNMFIANSVTECHLKNHFDKNDVISIMWTNVSREDRYVSGKWLNAGNIYTTPIYDKKFIDKFADTRGYLIRDLALIYLTQQLLEKIGCRYYFFSMVPVFNADQYDLSETQECQDLQSAYSDLLALIRPSVFSTVFNDDWYSRPFLPQPTTQVQQMYENCSGPDWPSWQQFISGDLDGVDEKILAEINDTSRWDWKKLIRQQRRKDPHPTPLEHLEYLTKAFTEYTIKSEIQQWVNDIEFLIQQDKPIDHLWQPKIIERW